MKILLFSDVHGNLPALEKVIQSEIVDGYINLGDVVNYGPWSNECVDYINNLENCINIEGNHERYFKAQKCNVKHPIVNVFFEESFKGFNKQDLILNYKKEIHFQGFKCVHTIESKYIFWDTEITLEENSIIGHSHQQFLREENGFKLINPGSIGQNRKYINLSNYIIWDTEKKKFDLKFMQYDIEILLQEMKNRNYPQQCIDYYNSKERY